MLNLLDEFKLIVNVLEREKIEYAICGGMAMAIHGFLRTTVDIDILLIKESISKTKKVFYDYGYKIESNPLSFSNGNTIIHRITKIDKDTEDFIVLDILEITESMKSIWNNRKKINWKFGTISVVDKSGLIEMKKLRNSNIDIIDIEWLKNNE